MGGDESVMAELVEEFVGSLFPSIGCSESEALAFGIMSYGCLNTAEVLCSVFVQLAHYPHIQAKVYNELLAASGSGNPLTEADITKMVFLAASVHEAARLLTTAPFLQRCSVDHDIELLPGVTIPAGAILAAPMQLIHQDGIYWGEDADIFNPYRFLKASNMSKEALAANSYVKAITTYRSVEEHSSTGGPELNPAFLVYVVGLVPASGPTSHSSNSVALWPSSSCVLR